MKQRKIVYKLEWEIGSFECIVMARSWYHLKTIVDWLLSYYKWWDIISINEIDSD